LIDISSAITFFSRKHTLLPPISITPPFIAIDIRRCWLSAADYDTP
jgi:hypothetical protein